MSQARSVVPTCSETTRARGGSGAEKAALDRLCKAGDEGQKKDLQMKIALASVAKANKKTLPTPGKSAPGRPARASVGEAASWINCLLEQPSAPTVAPERLPYLVGGARYVLNQTVDLAGERRYEQATGPDQESDDEQYHHNQRHLFGKPGKGWASGRLSAFRATASSGPIKSSSTSAARQTSTLRKNANKALPRASHRR